MPLYEVAIIEKPTKKELEEGVVEKLVFGPKAIVARDPQSAGIGAVMGEGLKIDMNKSEVLVRPFA
jgi:hypothetical protein